MTGHLVVFSVAKDYFELIKAPQKGLYWVDEAGHFLDTDQPGVFADRVKEILALL